VGEVHSGIFVFARRFETMGCMKPEDADVRISYLNQQLLQLVNVGMTGRKDGVDWTNLMDYIMRIRGMH
jgi:hypothetical protein